MESSVGGAGVDAASEPRRGGSEASATMCARRVARALTWMALNAPRCSRTSLWSCCQVRQPLMRPVRSRAWSAAVRPSAPPGCGVKAGAGAPGPVRCCWCRSWLRACAAATSCEGERARAWPTHSSGMGLQRDGTAALVWCSCPPPYDSEPKNANPAQPHAHPSNPAVVTWTPGRGCASSALRVASLMAWHGCSRQPVLARSAPCALGRILHSARNTPGGRSLSAGHVARGWTNDWPQPLRRRAHAATAQAAQVTMRANTEAGSGIPPARHRPGLHWHRSWCTPVTEWGLNLPLCCHGHHRAGWKDNGRKEKERRAVYRAASSAGNPCLSGVMCSQQPAAAPQFFEGGATSLGVPPAIWITTPSVLELESLQSALLLLGRLADTHSDVVDLGATHS